MKVVGLISGGKDSIYNLMQCAAHGHQIICLANLHPEQPSELDSFMYQSVGVEITPFIADAIGLPLLRRAISG
jgi:diphthine-ammonia ligase